MNWKFFVQLAIGFLESAGVAKQNEDANAEGLDDVIGDGLVYAAKFVRWLLNGANPSNKPKIPEGIK